MLCGRVERHQRTRLAVVAGPRREGRRVRHRDAPRDVPGAAGAWAASTSSWRSRASPVLARACVRCFVDGKLVASMACWGRRTRWRGSHEPQPLKPGPQSSLGARQDAIQKTGAKACYRLVGARGQMLLARAGSSSRGARAGGLRRPRTPHAEARQKHHKTDRPTPPRRSASACSAATPSTRRRART